MTRLQPYLLGIAVLVAGGTFGAESPYGSSVDFAKYAMSLRESAISGIEPRVMTPTTARTTGGVSGWRNDIVTTVFWVGESASANNPVHNRSSSWDSDWSSSFGGYDNPDPTARKDFRPASFVPRQNPFYIALPYNDVTRGETKPEASKVIPWFKTAFVAHGKSVCKDRWIAVRNRRNGRIAYGQWSDCGPFSTDHWQYVFGPERPKPNLNGGAGLDVSPSVRDYLSLANTDVTDWRFVDVREVPAGPWRNFGENNQFFTGAQRLREQVVSNATPPPPKPATNLPNVRTTAPR